MRLYIYFLSYWKKLDNFHYVLGETIKGFCKWFRCSCESLESPSSCWNLQNSYSFRKCGLLNKKYRYSPFKKCMEAFPELADRAYEACRKDYCSTPIDSEATLCRHLEGFADLCAKRGKILYWRYRVPSCKKSKSFVCQAIYSYIFAHKLIKLLISNNKRYNCSQYYIKQIHVTIKVFFWKRFFFSSQLKKLIRYMFMVIFYIFYNIT